MQDIVCSESVTSLTEQTSADGFGLRPEDLEPSRIDLARNNLGRGNASPIDSAGLWSQDLYATGYADFGYEALVPRDKSPSAPIILLSAAVGLLVGMITFYLAYQLLWLRVEIATGLSLVMLFIGLAITSIGLSSLSNSDAVMSNLAFSCGLILLSVLFFGLCIVTGALSATILLLLAN